MASKKNNETVENATNAWTGMVDQQVEKMTAAFDEFNKLQNQSREQFVATVGQMQAEMNRLFTAQIDYMGNLQQEWQKMTIENARRTAEVVTSTTRG